MGCPLGNRWSHAGESDAKRVLCVAKLEIGGSKRAIGGAKRDLGVAKMKISGTKRAICRVPSGL